MKKQNKEEKIKVVFVESDTSQEEKERRITEAFKILFDKLDEKIEKE